MVLHEQAFANIFHQPVLQPVKSIAFFSGVEFLKSGLICVVLSAFAYKFKKFQVFSILNIYGAACVYPEMF